MSRPHKSRLAKSLGWDIEIYVSSQYNHLNQQNGFEQSRWMRQRLSLGYPPAFESELNGPGVHLARDLFSGYNELAGVDGNLFVTGRSLQTGQPCNSQNLSGMIAFLWYSKENGRDINQQVGEYKEGTPRYCISAWLCRC